jgi:ferric-dicitrate binding protein FerR (iron transport regulator)
MTDKKNDDLPAWESQVNALLDSELDEASTEALKQAANEDRELARAIIEAFQLQRSMDSVGIERAPASLRRKLRDIPRNNRQSRSPRRWVMATAMASIPLLAIGLVLMQPGQPSTADVEQARQDLSVAFIYIDKVGSLTGNRIHEVLGSELHSGVTDNLSKHIPFTEQSTKEKNT